jgi:hypothetical protein
MKKSLTFIITVSTILLSTSCSIFSNPDEIALKCKQTMKIETSFKEPGAEISVSNVKFEEIYLINLKNKTVQLYTDTSITPQEDVVLAPKSINFKKTNINFGKVTNRSYWLNRETLKISSLGSSTDVLLEQFISGEGVCKKIPYPPMVSSKNKI